MRGMIIIGTGVIVLLCAICGLLGLIAGININPGSTVRYVPNWAILADWVTGIAAVLTLTVAFAAMSTWKKQERRQLVLRWKAALADYTWTLPYLKEKINYHDDKEDVERIAEKFYQCIASYVLMIEVVQPSKIDYYRKIWNDAHDTHEAFIAGKSTRDATKDAFAKICLIKFL